MTRFWGYVSGRGYFLITFLTLCAVILLGASFHEHRSTKRSLAAAQLATAPVWPLSSAGGHFGQEPRTVFPYSIIPGGAESPQELRQAVTMDPVVARHYSDFDLAKIRRVTLNTPQMMYVSYRIGNNVLWTRHKMTLPKGETMLTDGNLMARTRCGNRVSAVPISPNALVEPAAEEFNAPTFAPLSTPYLAAYPALRAAFPSGLGTQPTGRSISPSTPIAPFFPLPGGGGGGSSPPPVVPIPAPIGVPEPGTAGLVLVGLGATWLMRRNRKAR